MTAHDTLQNVCAQYTFWLLTDLNDLQIGDGPQASKLSRLTTSKPTSSSNIQAKVRLSVQSCLVTLNGSILPCAPQRQETCFLGLPDLGTLAGS